MKSILRLFTMLVVFLALAAPAAAQTPAPEYRLRSQRLFGYGGFSGDIRGTFQLSVTGPADTIQSVTYQIDGQPMATVDQSPYSLTFQTGTYPEGWHQLTALVTTRDGRTATTNALTLNFVSAQAENSLMGKILIPLFGGIALVLVISVGVQAIVMRRHPERSAPGAPRHYGLKGGAICPRCGRAFPIHLWSLNLAGHYLDRCDFCGRVGIVARASRAQLEAAEAAERAGAQASENNLPGAAEETEEERLRRMLDESKYTR